MTGFDTEWQKHLEAIEKQKIVMVVYFRPDKLPKDKAEWYEWLGNYAHSMSQMFEQGIMDNKATKDFKF